MFYDIFFFNDTAATEIYTLSLHDALPISTRRMEVVIRGALGTGRPDEDLELVGGQRDALLVTRGAELGDHVCRRERRSEEHTSELQSRQYIVCRLLLEKKKNTRLFRRLQQ